jgi:ribosomal protein S18 acetylase RimI-like enzyme
MAAAHHSTTAASSTKSETLLGLLPEHILVSPLTPALLPSFRRAISTLLPIRYPDAFFNDILADSIAFLLAFAAVDRSRGSSASSINGTAIGGIRCRLEPSTREDTYDVYIQALGVLAPHRRQGIAAHLLDAVLDSALANYNVGSIYAHVWEENQDGLEWYKKQGFEVGELIQDYYRKLRPKGARIVRKKLSSNG